jgi:hypothetical protein
MVAVRSLGTFSSADGVSQLLFRLSVTSTAYCLSEMTAPWGFQVAARENPAFHPAHRRIGLAAGRGGARAD